jgi:hypothetical protein
VGVSHLEGLFDFLYSKRVVREWWRKGGGRWVIRVGGVTKVVCLEMESFVFISDGKLTISVKSSNGSRANTLVPLGDAPYGVRCALLNQLGVKTCASAPMDSSGAALDKLTLLA